MRNFQKIAMGVDFIPLLHSIQRQPELWNENKLRTLYKESPHTQVDDIWLRFGDLDLYKDDALAFIDEHENINYNGWYKLPLAQQIIFDLMRRVGGTRLGRVIITRLSPGKEITPHVDGGTHAAYYERYHVMLQNGPGSVFHCGDEAVCMLPGDVYWFNNQLTHSVVNNGNDDRITMICDLRVEK